MPATIKKSKEIKHVSPVWIGVSKKHESVLLSSSSFVKPTRSPNNKDISFALHKSVDSLKKSILSKDYRYIREHLNVFRPIG